MKKFAKKFSFMVIASALAATSLVGCSQDEPTTEKTEQGKDTTDSGDKEEVTEPKGTMVVGSLEFNGIFSPLFYTTAYDGDIVDMVHAGLLTLDREGQVVPNLANFELVEVENPVDAEGNPVLDAEGNPIKKQTVYTFTLQEGLVFSDGEAITSDDVIFTYKVLCDPTYDGSSTVATLPIVGLDEYKNGDATEISGIERIDDLTVKVTLNGVDPTALNKFRMSVVPEHYYGADYEKGKLEGVKSVNGAPVGAGPYKFVEFENNVVSLEANTSYFEGTPKIAKLKYQVVDEANKLEAIKSETIDTSDPSASPEMVEMVEEAGLHHVLVDNPGFGYIGMNKERIPDQNVRKGLMHLMNRGPAIEAYYGDLATVIERPMTTVSWAYPQDAEEYYGYDTEKALEYFKAAGYTQDATGKLVKDGEQLTIEVGIGGIANHPTGPVLTQMKTDMDAMGAVLEIVDTDWNVFSDRLNAEDWDMFVLAVGASTDPDMYQYYHTKGSTAYYNIDNPELDKLIEDARSTIDVEVRKEIYAEALDLVMDEAVVMPIYQRMNMFVFNPEYVDITSLPEDMTAYYDHFSDIQDVSTVLPK